MKSLVLALSLVVTQTLPGAPLKVTDLRTNLLEAPEGVGTSPEFSWKLASSERGKRQTAYQIIAATSPDKLTEEEADLWNSKKQPFPRSTFLPWEGSDLKSSKIVHWKVRVWDDKKEVGPWSDPATFRIAGKKVLPKPKRVSSFECSSAALNKLYTDSLGELEKRLTNLANGDPGALGDGAKVQRSARAMLYHFDALPHLNHWITSIDASITKDHTFPVFPGSTKVGSASSEGAICVSHPVWWMGGDSRVPKQRWPKFERHMVFRESKDPRFKGIAWGEIKGSEGMSPEYLDLVYLAFTTRLIRELASPAEQPNNVFRFQDYAGRMRKSFREQHLNKDRSLKTASQSAHLTALRSDILGPEQKQKVIADLMASLSRDGLQIGPIGAYYLPAVLTLTKNHEKAVALLEGLSPEERKLFAGNGISEWLMAYAAGIDAAFPGFGQVRIAPRIPTDDSLTWVKASYESIAGTVSTHWEKLKEGGVKIDVTIPAGVPIAQLNLPCPEGAKVTEGGKSVEEAPAVELVGQSGGIASLVTQSGSYSFVIK